MSSIRPSDDTRSGRSPLFKDKDSFPVRDDDSIVHDEHVSAGDKEIKENGEKSSDSGKK